MPIRAKYGAPFPSRVSFPPRQRAVPGKEPEIVVTKYGVPFPHRQTAVSESIPIYGAPMLPPRQPAVPEIQGSDDPSQIAYDRGLVEGRRQILTWTKTAIDLLGPMLQMSPAGQILVDGFRRQIVKYLQSGENPLEKGGGQSDDGR